MVLLRLVAFVVRLALLPLLGLRMVLRRRLPGSVVEFPVRRRGLLSYLSFGGPRSLALSSLHQLIDEVNEEPRIRGVLFVIRSLRSGMATTTSLRTALLRLRDEAKREVVVYLPNGGDTKELYCATAASRIIVGPRSTLAPVGFLSSSRYAKRALDKLGVRAERLTAGSFKSAGETLDHERMSEAQKEQLDALLDTFYDELISAIATGRHVDASRAKELVDRAPYAADDAVSAGLVDAVAYEDQLPAMLGGVHVVSGERFLAARRARLLPRITRPRVLAVLPLHGAITSGIGPVATDERFIGAVRLLRQSRRVRGVLLHVDSPGGGALASDRMHHELEQLAKEKPVVAYFGDVAASGGYYAAAAAHYIVAAPTTITGSIGVVAARVVIEPLLERLGIVTETIRRGAHAALLDPLHPIDDGERSALEGEIRHIYDGFVDVVAAGRKRTREEVHAIAQGRVWSGLHAKTHGLVDELGDSRTALAALRTRVGPDATKLDVVTVRAPFQRTQPLPPPTTSWLALLGSRERVLAISLLPPIV
jgi:protease-4